MLRNHFWFAGICFGTLLTVAFLIALGVVYQNVESKRLGFRLGQLVEIKRELLQQQNELAIEIAQLEQTLLGQLPQTAGTLTAATSSMPVWEITSDAHQLATP
jgi:hypothetical protein